MTGAALGKRLGPYVIRGRLGAGGMGTVYVAEHELMGRRAAVKVLLPQYSSNPDMIKRFVNEARAAAAVKHAGIVEIYDINYADGGVPYIAMELLEGQNLGQRLQQGELDRSSVFAIAGQIAGALDAAHRAGVVHRDLKPDNVFLVRGATARPQVKLLDFGVAKVVERHLDDHMTQTGMIVGTPSYMSPEQCRSQPVDHRTDLYALGCIVFRMIAGHVPFRGESTFDVIAGHVATPAPALSSVAREVTPALDALIARLLAKPPAARPASAGELVPIFAELEAAAQRPRFAAMSTEPDITLPTRRVEIPDDAPTKQTVGVAQLAALARPPALPRIDQRATAPLAVASAPPPAPRTDDIEQMPSMLLVPEDLVPSPPPRAAPAAPLPGVAARPNAPPVSPAPAMPPPTLAMTPPPPAPNLPTPVPQMLSTMTLGSAAYQVAVPETGASWRIWLVSALAFIAAAVGVTVLLDRSGGRGGEPRGAAAPPVDASTRVGVASGEAEDPAAGTVDAAPAEAMDVPPAPEAAQEAIDEDVGAEVDLDAIEMLGSGSSRRGSRTAVRSPRSGPMPADVLMADQLREEARSAHLKGAYSAERDLLYQAYRLDPQRRDLLSLGDVSMLSGNFPQARAYYGNLIRSAPDSREATVARSRLEVMARKVRPAPADARPLEPPPVDPASPGAMPPAP